MAKTKHSTSASSSHQDLEKGITKDAASSGQAKKARKKRKCRHRHGHGKNYSDAPKRKSCLHEFLSGVVAVLCMIGVTAFPPLGAWHLTHWHFLDPDCLIALGLFPFLILPSHIWVLYLEGTYYTRCLKIDLAPHAAFIHCHRIRTANGRFEVKREHEWRAHDDDKDYREVHDEPDDGRWVTFLIWVGEGITKPVRWLGKKPVFRWLVREDEEVEEKGKEDVKKVEEKEEKHKDGEKHGHQKGKGHK